MTDSNTFDADLRAAFDPAYVLERELTGGGMSRVFLATERALNRRVVIKVLPPELAAGVNRERFRREIQLAAQLQHPHIVPLYSAGEYGELLYYTMPFIEGESLKHAIHERGKQTRFSPKEVAGILHDVVDALAYAHARGVIHRDIKPGNVLRSGRHAVVTDFGVAKAISASMPAVGVTTSGMAIGTPAYMAPEQLAGDPAADHRVDIYAVGLLAYELLTGEAPFSEPSPQETMAAQLTRDPQPIDRTRLDVPPSLSALVMHCLAKSPEKRPQDATELLGQLDALALPSGDYQPSASPRKGRRAALIGVALLLAALVWAGRERIASANADAQAKTDSAAAAAKALPPAPAPRPTLTRADSLAIATAVEKKMAERAVSAPVPVRNDSAAIAQIANQLRAEIEQAVLDSLAKNPPRFPPPGTASQVIIDRGGGRRFTGMTPAQVDSMLRSARGAPGAASDFSVRFRGEVTDPAGDALVDSRVPHPPDLVSATVEVSDAAITFRARFASGTFDRSTVAVLFWLDTDKDPATGVRMGGLGVDYTLGLGEQFYGTAGSVSKASPGSCFRADPPYCWVAVGRVPVIFHPDGMDATVPRSLFTGLDGRLDFRVLTYVKPATERFSITTDQMPDVGLPAAHVLPAQVDSMLRSARGPAGAPSDFSERFRGRTDKLDKAAFDARSANMGPTRRVVVWNHPPDRRNQTMQDAGSAIMNVFRKVLGAQPRFAQVDRDSTVALLARTRDRDSVSRTLNADMMATIRGNPMPGDSVMWVLTVHDLTAHSSYAQRAVSAGRVPLSDPLANVDSLMAKAGRALQELDRAPRRSADPQRATAPAIPAPPSAPPKKP